MEEKGKKSNAKKIVIGICAALVLAILCVVLMFVYNSTKDTPEEGGKSITVQVISERDSYSFEQEYKTDEDYLGDFLEKENLIGFDTSDYGRFITSVQGYAANNEDQSWWSISVNGESAMTGVDEIAIKDNAVYLLELKIGW